MVVNGESRPRDVIEESVAPNGMRIVFKNWGTDRAERVIYNGDGSWHSTWKPGMRSVEDFGWAPDGDIVRINKSWLPSVASFGAWDEMPGKVLAYDI